MFLKFKIPMLGAIAAMSISVLAKARIGEGDLVIRPKLAATAVPATSHAPVATPSPVPWHGPGNGCLRIVGCYDDFTQ